MKIQVKNLCKSFRETQVVQDVSFTIEQGELVSLLGPSGCGKTTVLRMVAGLEVPTSGKILLGEKVLSDEKYFLEPHLREIGMVFQSYALWPHRTVFQNVSFPLEIQNIKKEERIQKIEKTLKLVGLEKFSKRYPHELSGGQQQRVALARSIAQAPKVLLLDEPLSNLDAKLREQMRRELKSLQRELGLTMLYVTHDRLEALELSHRMAILDHGKLVQMGTPAEIVSKPINEFVAHFVA